ncbi:MFS general substrate transporter [Cubamyces sp. BRFM 1775]|nr:MFS general substrate transporter [Cubamyces sp. BRFM 1775]
MSIGIIVHGGKSKPGMRQDQEKQLEAAILDGSGSALKVDEPFSKSQELVEYGEPPDGGLKAWLIVAGCAVGSCATFGFVNAWGVFQAYYEEQVLAGTSPSTIAWISSIQYALVFLPGLFTGRIFDMGWTKIPLAGASALIVAVAFLIAECTKYWHLAGGVAFGMCLDCPAQWFKRRLGLALGFMAVGSSIGGTCFPIAVKNLVEQVGFKWTMRIVGFIELVLLPFMVATDQRRLPPRKHSGPFSDFTAFKQLLYSLYNAATFLVFLGILTVESSHSSDDEKIIDEDYAFYLVAIANACSTVGRLSGGYLADHHLDPLTVMTPVTAVAGILTYAWPFAHSVGGYTAIAAIYGCASGVYASLLPAPVVRMGETHDIGLRVGMSMTIIAISALVGPPISGAINSATGGFKYTGVYAGTTIIVGCCFLVATRFTFLGGLRGTI